MGLETVWDWITMIAFGGLIVLMLQRSSEEVPRDRLHQYLVPSAGCALANYIGNHYSDIGAGIAMLLVAVYVNTVLKFPPASFFDRRER